jgi:large subunit ribosomal protein L21
VFAIVEDSGTQIKVSPGDVIEVDLRDLPAKGKRIVFDRVLAVGGEGEPRIGLPYLEGVKVTAEILEEKTGPKVLVVKFRRRKGYRRKVGHRQKHLRVRIDSIEA